VALKRRKATTVRNCVSRKPAVKGRPMILGSRAIHRRSHYTLPTEITDSIDDLNGAGPAISQITAVNDQVACDLMNICQSQ
jgi:hypothetical protein